MEQEKQAGDGAERGGFHATLQSRQLLDGPRNLERVRSQKKNRITSSLYKNR